MCGARENDSPYQTCAKVPKRFEILGSLSPRSETLMDLGPCTSFLPWDSGNPGPQNCVMPQDPGNPGPQNFDSRKSLETQDLKIWICGETLETQDPEPQNCDASRLNPRPTGGGGYFEPPSRFLAISSKPLQVSPPNLQYPLSQHFYTLC